jgi:uncharacterized protein (UPF0335 family)
MAKRGTTRALRTTGDQRVSDTDLQDAKASRERQAADPESEVGGIAADRLRSIIERVERLEEERKALAGDIKDIFAEAKSAGFDVKVIRQIISIRKKEPAEVEEQQSLLDLYMRALGM